MNHLPVPEIYIQSEQFSSLLVRDSKQSSSGLQKSSHWLCFAITIKYLKAKKTTELCTQGNCAMSQSDTCNPLEHQPTASSSLPPAPTALLTSKLINAPKTSLDVSLHTPSQSQTVLCRSSGAL